MENKKWVLLLNPDYQWSPEQKHRLFSRRVIAANKLESRMLDRFERFSEAHVCIGLMHELEADLYDLALRSERVTIHGCECDRQDKERIAKEIGAEYKQCNCSGQEAFDMLIQEYSG